MVLSKTLSAPCGWCVEGLWVECGTGGAGCASPLPPTSPWGGWWRVGHEEQLVELGAVLLTAAEKPLGSGIYGEWEHSHVFRAQEWSGTTIFMKGLEASVGRKRSCQRNLLWKHETFRCEFSSPSYPCLCLWLDSQEGMCPLLFRPVYVTLNSTTPLTIREMKTPEGQTSVPHSAFEATQGICVLSQPPNKKKNQNNKDAEKAWHCKISAGIKIKAVLGYLLQTRTTNTFWMFIHFLVLHCVYCWLWRECTWICFHNDFMKRSNPTESR